MDLRQLRQHRDRHKQSVDGATDSEEGSDNHQHLHIINKGAGLWGGAVGGAMGQGHHQLRARSQGKVLQPAHREEAFQNTVSPWGTRDGWEG